MRNNIIDNIRGLCMLGVIGIHIGSLALAPNNFVLYCFLEILSRYSVPAFFFISGYGLCCTDKKLLTGENLDYKNFLVKRFRSAGLPYLSWSFFYLLYFWLILPPGFISWQPTHLAFVLFFGLACYHLYFMVILLWFYALYPIWRLMLCSFLKYGLKICLPSLFIFQLVFNWWTTHPHIDVASLNIVCYNFFQYRLNYLPLHYLLIFISGCLAAIYWDKFILCLRQHNKSVIIIYLLAITYDVGSAYYAFAFKNYSLLDLANTYHQLSPQGLIYTLASLLFFCWILDYLEKSSQSQNNKFAYYTQKMIATLSNYSMLIYFIHPLLLDWLSSFYNKFGILMTVKKVSFSYFLLVVTSLAVSILLTKFFRKTPYLSLLFTGKK